MAFLAFPAAALADGAPRLAVNRTSVPKARSTTVRLTLTEAHGGCLAVFVPATYRLDKAVTSPRGVVRPLVIRLKQGRWDRRRAERPQDRQGSSSGRPPRPPGLGDRHRQRTVRLGGGNLRRARLHRKASPCHAPGDDHHRRSNEIQAGRAGSSRGWRGTTQPSPKATKPAQPPSPNIDRSPPTDIGPDARTVRSTLDSPNRGLALTLNLGLDLAEWIVPGVVLTMPGLLLTIFIGAQVLGAAAWLPACRRYLGTFGVRRKPKRPA